MNGEPVTNPPTLSSLMELSQAIKEQHGPNYRAFSLEYTSKHFSEYGLTPSQIESLKAGEKYHLALEKAWGDFHSSLKLQGEKGLGQMRERSKSS